MGEEEDDDDDIFFTEDDYEMFSLSRIHNISARCHQDTKDWRDVVAKEKERRRAEQEKQAKKGGKASKEPGNPQNSSQPTPGASPQKPKVKVAPNLYSLISPNPNVRYPTFSRLTFLQHKRFLELQAKYGSKGIRVTTSKQSAELQQWRQLGAHIYQDQQDFNAFAEFIAKSQSERYASLPTGAMQYMKDSLKRNLERVESLPQHYAVVQTVTLNPGVPLPSDPTLQRIRSPVFVGKSQEVVVPPLEEQKVILKTSDLDGDEIQPEENGLNMTNCQRLAEIHKVDIALSASSFYTLVNNHAPLYEHQWEMPLLVKESSSGKTAFIEEPLMKHLYYPHDASGIYHNVVLKRMLTSGVNEKYCKVLDRTDDDEMTFEQHDTPLIDDQEPDADEFGSMSLAALETFGSDLRNSAKSKAADVEEVEEISETALPVPMESDRRELLNVVNVESGSVMVSEAAPVDGKSVKDPDVKMESIDDPSSGIGESKNLQHSLSSEDAHIASMDSTAQSENKDDDAEEMMKLAADAKSRIVKVVVRRASTSADEITTDDEASGTPLQRSRNGGKNNDHLNIKHKDSKVDKKRKTSKKKCDKNDIRLMSDSSDDGHNLVIMTESDAASNPSSPQCRPSPKQPEKKVQPAEPVASPSTGMDHDRTVQEAVTAESLNIKAETVMKQELDVKKEVSVDATGDQRWEDIRQKQDESFTAMDTSEMDAPEETNTCQETKGKSGGEDPDGRIATRRSTRIRKQSSSDGNTSTGQVEEVPMKRKRGRPRKQPIKEESTCSVDMKQVKIHGGEKEISQSEVAFMKKDEQVSETRMSLRTRTRKDSTADHGKDTNADHGKDTTADFEKGTKELAKEPEEGNEQVQRMSQNKDMRKQDSKVAQKKEDALPIKAASTRKGTAKKGPTAKSSTPKKPANKGDKSKAESTIDEIMRLQEKMLTRQKSNGQQPSQSQPQGRGQGHEGDTVRVKETDSISGLLPEGVELESPVEGTWAYSLWKFGRLRLLTQSKCSSMLKGDFVNIAEKMEYQSDLGLQMQTSSELTKMWINLFLNPGSKLFRGRIDCRSSEILSWECIDGSTMVQSQTFNPAMCMKVLYLILGKIAALSEGQYLLRHRPGDGHVCIYQCVNPSAKNVRAPYDLHAAHRASQLMTSLPPTIPWVPLDPSAPYRRSRWSGCVPLTFPPCPPNFKHPSLQHGKHRKKKKKR